MVHVFDVEVVVGFLVDVTEVGLLVGLEVVVGLAVVLVVGFVDDGLLVVVSGRGGSGVGPIITVRVGSGPSVCLLLSGTVKIGTVRVWPGFPQITDRVYSAFRAVIGTTMGGRVRVIPGFPQIIVLV